jgi:hypothetical protein
MSNRTTERDDKDKLFYRRNDPRYKAVLCKLTRLQDKRGVRHYRVWMEYFPDLKENEQVGKNRTGAKRLVKPEDFMGSDAKERAYARLGTWMKQLEDKGYVPAGGSVVRTVDTPAAETVESFFNSAF